MSRRADRKQRREQQLGRKLRVNFPRALPAPPGAVVEVPYAKRYEHDFNEGEAVAWLMARPEWEETIGAECDLVESERPRHGPKPSYTTRELETALFYQVMLGIRTWKAARKELAGDTGGRARRALGFDDMTRQTRSPRELKRLVGVPSESTMSRHRKRFPWERRLAPYRAYFDRLRKLNAQDPELREGLRILGIDGTAQPTSLTCPKVNSDTGEVVNAARVTCPEGGYRVKSDSKDHGFSVVPLHCVNGLPWAYDHATINTDERVAAARTIADFRDNVLPYTGPRRLAVLTADTNFHNQELRPLLQGLGIVPNINHVSHAEGRASTERAKADAERLQFDIDGKDGWYVDGFRELHHSCGNPVHTYRRIKQRGQRAVLALEGDCKCCKSTITLTSGEYKKVRDLTRESGDPRGTYKFTRVHPSDPDSVRKWDLGNPLTYHDEYGGLFGAMRFGHGEGFNGACVKRFKLFKTKAYLEGGARAELHALMVFCAMHRLTQRRRELEAASEFRHAADRPQRTGWTQQRAA